MNDDSLTLSIELLDGYRMRVDFGMPGVPPLVLDEPAPLGAGQGPNPSRVLAAAIGSCLSASLLFCLRKAHVDVQGVKSSVDVQLTRNEKGRLRIGDVTVAIHPEMKPEDAERIGRCAGLFEDFCVVTQSVRKGIDVKVVLEPKLG